MNQAKRSAFICRQLLSLLLQDKGTFAVKQDGLGPWPLPEYEQKRAGMLAYLRPRLLWKAYSGPERIMIAVSTVGAALIVAAIAQDQSVPPAAPASVASATGGLQQQARLPVGAGQQLSLADAR